MYKQEKDYNIGHGNQTNNQLQQTISALNKKKDEYLQDIFFKAKKIKENEVVIEQNKYRIKDLENLVKEMEVKILRLQEDVIGKNEIQKRLRQNLGKVELQNGILKFDAQNFSHNNIEHNKSTKKTLEDKTKKIEEMSEAIVLIQKAFDQKEQTLQKQIKLLQQLYQNKIKILDDQNRNNIKQAEQRNQEEIRKIKQFHKEYVEQLKEKYGSKNQNISTKMNGGGQSQKKDKQISNLNDKIKLQEKQLVEARKLLEQTFDQANKNMKENEVCSLNMIKLKQRWEKELKQKDDLVEYLTKLNKTEEGERKKLTHIKDNLLLEVTKLQKQIQNFNVNQDACVLSNLEIQKAKFLQEMYRKENEILKQQIQRQKDNLQKNEIAMKQKNQLANSLEQQILNLKNETQKRTAEDSEKIIKYSNQVKNYEQQAIKMRIKLEQSEQKYNELKQADLRLQETYCLQISNLQKKICPRLSIDFEMQTQHDVKASAPEDSVQHFKIYSQVISQIICSTVNTDKNYDEITSKEIEMLKQEQTERQGVISVMESCINDYKVMVKQMKTKIEEQQKIKCQYEQILAIFEIKESPSTHVHDELMQIITIMISKLENVDELEQEIQKLNDENVDLKDRRKSFIRQVKRFDEAVDQVSIENQKLKLKNSQLKIKLQQNSSYVKQLIKVIEDTNEATMKNYMKLFNHKVQTQIEYDNQECKSSFSFDEPNFSMTKTNSHVSQEVQLFVFTQTKSEIKAPKRSLYDLPNQQENQQLIEIEVEERTEQASCLTPPAICKDQQDFLAKLQGSPQLIDYEQNQQQNKVPMRSNTKNCTPGTDDQDQ